MTILGVIPARYDSSRLPGKALALIGKRPMVQWVYEAAKRCAMFADVVVATDSDQVAACVRGFGGAVEMTRSDHTTGTDRVAEVAERHPDMTVVVNVQGDVPFVTPAMLTQLISPYVQGDSPDMATLACPLDMVTDYPDPNVVKVVCDRSNRALYFSRAAIPYYRHAESAPVFRHVGLYAYRRDFLQHYATLTPTPLERCEALEQLRVLEHGHTIIVCHTPETVLDVNTPDDLRQAQAFAAQIT